MLGTLLYDGHNKAVKGKERWNQDMKLFAINKEGIIG